MTALPASVLFGLLWKRFGPRTAFLTGAAVALTAAVALWFATRQLRAGRGEQIVTA